MALPILVLPVKRVSAIIMITQAAIVTRASAVITSLPSKSLSAGRSMTEWKDLGVEPQMSSARFWSR